MPILKKTFIATAENPPNAVHTVYCSNITNENNKVYYAYSVLVIGQEALAIASACLYGYKIYILVHSTLHDYLKRMHAFIAYYSDPVSLYAALL